MSQRRTARDLGVNRKTVARRLRFLGAESLKLLAFSTAEGAKVTHMQFDDMETFEHTKCKPLSITLAVEVPTRRILGFRVAKMPPKSSLAKLARKKYGFRKDERKQARTSLLKELQPVLAPGALVESDQNPHYPPDVKEHLPGCLHQTHPGKRGALTGQGELKKVGFDPLFSLNHTCAMFRANVCRLIRKTWCTTKDPARLIDHLAIYAVYHNSYLK